MEEIYDKVSKVLTWVENPEEYPFDKEELNEEMYDTLVQVHKFLENQLY